MNNVALEVQELSRFVTEVFRRVGMTSEDAGIMTQSLVEADLHGVGTHGVARVAAYVSQLNSGQVNAAPEEVVVAERPAALLVDAGNGFGAPVGIRVVEAGMRKAADQGICLVGVRNVAHFGAAGFYTRHAADRGFLAMAMSSTSASVVPFGGRQARIGNSPMSFATPGLEHPELVMDMAQSMTSRGRIKVAAEQGETIPENWALDAQGSPTVDPREALNGAVLTSGGHKGSAMSLMVEMLASGLTGAHLTQDIRHAGFTDVSAVGAESGEDAGPGSRLDVTVGNLYLVVDADVFGDEAGVRTRATRVADYVRASAPAPGVDHVLAPGDLERHRRTAAERDGVTLRDSTYRELSGLAQRLDLRPPELSPAREGSRR